MEPTWGPAAFLNDPLNPPPAETRAYAGALAEELMFRGVKPKVVNQSALNGYLVIVPGASAGLGVEVRAGPGDVHMDDVKAVAGLLLRPPAQKRSVARVALLLEHAAQAVTEPGLTTTALAERAGMSVGVLYRYFADVDAVRWCVAEIWMRRTITAVEHARAADTRPDELARLLIQHIAAYRSCYRPPAHDAAVIRARTDREHAWHQQLAATLATVITDPAPTGQPDQRGQTDGDLSPLDTRCLIIVTLADRAARTATTNSRDPVTAGIEHMVAWYIRDANVGESAALSKAAAAPAVGSRPCPCGARSIEHQAHDCATT